MQVAGRLQSFAGNHREHPVHRFGRAAVDRQNLGVGVRATHDVHVQHTGQLDVVHVVTETLDETWILLAFHPVAHAADLGRRGDADFVGSFDVGRNAIGLLGVMFAERIEMGHADTSSPLPSAACSRSLSAAY